MTEHTMTITDEEALRLRQSVRDRQYHAIEEIIFDALCDYDPERESLSKKVNETTQKVFDLLDTVPQQ